MPTTYAKVVDDNEVNLIDLKDDAQEIDDYAIGKEDDGERPAVLDFCELKLIDNPIGELDGEALPQTLKDCVGYLRELPLLEPNATAMAHPAPSGSNTGPSNLSRIRRSPESRTRIGAATGSITLPSLFWTAQA